MIHRGGKPTQADWPRDCSRSLREDDHESFSGDAGCGVLHLDPDLAHGHRPGPIAISKPVGQGQLARNLPDDVKIIQEALNRVTVMGVVGGPMPFLAVDGIKGPKTQAAILNFQRVQVKSINADGLVEPGKQTILR